MKPILSIYIATYNHENYIKKAIDSVLMQETSYPFEVLIGEDCSTDNTRQVLKSIEPLLPSNFYIFYRGHNMHHEEIGNARDLISRCVGKYLIALEGDDFWIDSHKIQKQIDFLETHSDYFGVAHNCIVVDNNNNPNGEAYPECKDTEYTVQHYCSEIMPGQLTTFMYRNFYRFDILDLSFINAHTPAPGDRKMYYSFAINHLKIYCMQEVMSAYRHIVKGGSSFSATYKLDFKKDIAWYDELLKYSHNLNNHEAEFYGDLIYFRYLFVSLRQRDIGIVDFLNRVKIVTRPYFIFCALIYYKIRKVLLRKTVYVK